MDNKNDLCINQIMQIHELLETNELPQEFIDDLLLRLDDIITDVDSVINPDYDGYPFDEHTPYNHGQ